MDKITPITPEQVIKEKSKDIPECIIDAVNKLLVKNWKQSSCYAKILQNDILDMVADKYSRREVFDNGWLDIEDLYREAGWNVEYYRGPYWDTTPCYFTFTLKNK